MKSARSLAPVVLLSVLATIFVRDRIVRPPSAGDRLVAKFFEMYHGRAVQRNTRWNGVTIQQTPTDMWMVQEIIAELKPDFLIETGTLEGGSSLYYASVLESLDDDARIITVDIRDQVGRAKDYPVFRRYVTPIIGDSVAPGTIRAIEDLVQGRPALVLLDSDHHKEHVLQELRLYSKFVPVGGYMIVFDTDLNGHPVTPDYGPGPLEAVEAFLRTDGRFSPDRSREKFLLTMCQNGYLKRVR